MKVDFSGKTVAVTGASRGVGAATAVAFARAGASRVVIHFNSYCEGAEQAAAQVCAAGAEAHLIQADLSTVAGLDTCVARLAEVAPQVDILVNNAGSLVKRAALAEYTPELFDQVINLNLRCVWFVSQAVVPSMIRAGSGVIVNLSSIAARNGGGIGATIYAAAKAAVSAMTKGMARELAPKGIRVNAVSPGTVDNHFHEVFSTRQMLDGVIAQTPAGRLGNNEEVADLILFLSSPQAAYIIGQTVEINGGMYMV